MPPEKVRDELIAKIKTLPEVLRASLTLDWVAAELKKPIEEIGPLLLR